MAAGGPLRCVGDTLRSSASEPTGHPASDALPCIVLQHLRVRQKEKKKNRNVKSIKGVKLFHNFWKLKAVVLINSPFGFIIIIAPPFVTSLFLEAFYRRKLHLI